MKTPESLRAQVEKRAAYRCEYCLTIMDSSTERFEVEHIIPISRSGLTVLENLALACRGCNSCKYNKIQGMDELTGSTVDLFNPRKHIWTEHFIWDASNPVYVVGLTSIGRATIASLKLNRPQLISVRTLLQKIQLHPPLF